ncbi:MAG: DUF167 domain-containing protein [Myxococcota bacterium]|nr:DUF167 domain-containing protein [Myxococcota bacterium]
MPPYLKATPEGIELELVVQPRASRSRILGEHDGRLKVQIAAPPVDGEANSEVIAFFSGLFQVPKRQVELVSGEASKRKRIRVAGVSLERALQLL